MEDKLTKARIEEEFDKIANKYGASTILGLPVQRLADFKRRPDIKNQLFVLYLAGKLKLTD